MLCVEAAVWGWKLRERMMVVVVLIYTYLLYVVHIINTYYIMQKLNVFGVRLIHERRNYNLIRNTNRRDIIWHTTIRYIYIYYSLYVYCTIYEVISEIYPLFHLIKHWVILMNFERS